MKRTIKRSKKGFTLVELVVVIAILGVLAVIAIPIVFNILGSSSETAERSDAAALNEACRDYYAAVSSGVVNSTSKGGSTQSPLPPPNAPSSQRKVAAGNATVINACEYAGLDKIKNQLNRGYDIYGYDSSGTIKRKDGTTTPINASTQLKDIM